MQIKCINTKDGFCALEVLAKEIWREHFIPIIGEQQVEYMLNKFLKADVMEYSTLEESYAFYCIYEEDKAIGFFAIHPEEEYMFLSKLYIKKDYRGNGYARECLRFIESLTQKHGLKGIWLTCNKYNYNTLDIYKHLGFIVFDEAVNDIGMGYVMDDYYLRKIV